MIGLRVGAATHVGRNPGRTNNEDRFLVGDDVWVVADGVGGHAGGEVAAGTAVDVIAERFDPSAEAPLVTAIEAANRAVWEQAGSDPELTGMATTITAVARVSRDGTDQLIVANVGDSRTYLMRDGELSQLSVDHSQVEEMVRDGLISRPEASQHPYRHIVTRVLGMEREVGVDTWDLTPAPGDRFLLCSDGLIDEVPDPDIAAILRSEPDSQAAADHLVRAALDAGGSDNVTVVVLDIVGAGADGAGAEDGGAPVPPVADPPTSVEAALTPAPAPRAPAPRAPAPQGPAGRPAARPSEPPDQSPVVPPQTARAVTGLVPVVKPRRRGRLTWRVVLFVLALVVVLGGAGAAVVYYARGTYYVGLEGNQVTIFQGRPGGLLWFRPTIRERTDLSTDQVLSSSLSQLQSGMQESSLGAARQFVRNLYNAYQAANPGPGASGNTTGGGGGSTTASTSAATTPGSSSTTSAP